MALTRALNSALSGLNAQQFKLDVIGDNIANATTTGFKASRVEFKTMLSQTLRFGSAPQGSLGGVNPLQVGLGALVGTASRNFAQGTLDTTGVRGDVAIDGNGFFILNDGQGGQVYSRDGAFGLNPNSNLVDPATGFIVQGVNADPTTFALPSSGPVTDIVIPLNDLQIARATSNITFDGNLNSGGDTALMGTTLQTATLRDISGGLPGVTATGATPLADLGRATPGGGTLDLQIDLGDTITISATKGGRPLPELRFNVGSALLDGYDGFGTTLADLAAFAERALGINPSPASGVATNGIYSGVRDSDTNPNTIGVSFGATSLVATAGSASVTVTGEDFEAAGVRVGDVLRFNSGAGAGQVVRVRATPGAGSDTILVDDFDPNVPLPATGDLFTVHEPAGVSVVDATVTPWLNDGALYVAGNVGLANALSGIQLTNATDSINISPFTQIESAAGESFITNTTVYDSIGNPHLVESTFVLETKGEVDPVSGSVGNIWRVYNEAQDSMFQNTVGSIQGTRRSVGTGQITLSTVGQFLSQTPSSQTTWMQLSLPNQGALTPLAVDPDFGGMTGFADVVSNPFVQAQDGFATGTLVDYSVDQDGTVQGVFNNGILRPLARVGLARFSNNNGLDHIGDSLFRVNANSGQPIIGTAGTDGFGTLVGGALEGSNVDFAKEFTDLIVAQRAFLANSRVITRADELLDGLIAIV